MRTAPSRALRRARRRSAGDRARAGVDLLGDRLGRSRRIVRSAPQGWPARRATDLLVWGAAVHLTVDWMGQNEWIADNKSRVLHPAGYVHAGAHALGQLLVFRPETAAALGVAHLVIDSRHPLRLWSKLVAVPADGVVATEVQIWRDQVAHLGCIAVAALLSR